MTATVPAQNPENPPARGRIVWLASYPKSGNTWLRVLLANLNSGTPVDINRLEGGPWASARSILDEDLGLSTSDLTPAEVARLRPAIYRHLSRRVPDHFRVKTHDAFTLPDQTPLFPQDATRAAIYLVRHPFDVAVSFAHHLDQSPDEVIDIMADATWAQAARTDGAFPHVRQWVSSWSHNVRTWLDAAIPRMVVRYEDLWSHPEKTLSSVAEFLELPHTSAAVDRAVAWSSLQNLQKQESEHGFCEKFPRTRRFFRRGGMGEGRSVLSEAQRLRLISDHGDVMQRLGYEFS